MSAFARDPDTQPSLGCELNVRFRRQSGHKLRASCGVEGNAGVVYAQVFAHERKPLTVSL